MNSQNESAAFTNDIMELTVEKLPNCKVQFKVFVKPEAIKASYLKALKNINKEISVPGFRKGKAPDAFIVKNYPSAVEKEWKDLSMNTAINDAFKLSNIYPYSTKSISKAEITNISQESGGNFLFEFEQFPQIPKIDPKEIDLQPVKPEPITEEQEQSMLQKLRHHHAVWEDVSGRPSQKGDYVELDIEALEPSPHFLCKDETFQATEEKMPKWILNAILGLNAGEETIQTSVNEMPEGQNVNFTPTPCKITLKKIKSAQLPEVDDAFAKKIGCQTVEDLKENIRKTLEKQAKDDANLKMRDQLNDLLLEKYRFDIPESIINSEVRIRLQRQKEALEAQKYSSDQIQEFISNNIGVVEQKARQELQLFFLTQAIANENQLQVTEEELMNELRRQLMHSPESSLVDLSMKAEEIRSRLSVEILRKKAEDFLIEKVLSVNNSNA